MTRFAEVVDVTSAVAATTKRTEKKAAIAELLGRLDPDEIVPVIGFLTGEVRQGRIGIGWRTIAGVDAEPSHEPSLTVGDVDTAVDHLAALSGPGSQAARTEALHGLYAAATAPEGDVLGRLFVGELRTGALDGVVTDAIAVASDVKLPLVRRAAMLAGDLAAVARIALVDGADAVAAVGLEPLRAVSPMLASTSPDVAEAMEQVGEASVEWKLDGVRIQVHRAGDEVRIFTRNLNDITDRLPGVVAWATALPVDHVVLDGEILGGGGPGTPDAFQDTMSRVGRGDGDRAGELAASYFDVLHVDGVDLIDEPLSLRRRRLGEIVGDRLIPGTTTADADEAQQVLDDALARGHEGVMVKAVDSVYAAGRRGKSWRKVKPVYTLDLVVLAVEPGSGRRRGWLSNIHLGARREPAPGGDDRFVMVGKTFKGMTDEILAWQTARFRDLALPDDEQPSEFEVHVRPAQVVEIAVDGAQSSTRYPGGVALRFARVVRYRDDKTPAEADTIDAVRALLPAATRGPAADEFG